MPGEIRRQFRSEIQQARGEMREQGAPAWRITLRSLALLMIGFAQHVPLVGASERIDERSGWTDRAAVAGWFFWRLSGPTLFVGYAFAILPLVVVGAASLLACFACIGAVTANGRETYGEHEARVLNAVFGGLAAVIAFVAVFGVFCGALVAVGALFHMSALGGFSMRALVFMATMVCGVVCLAGWVPREWRPY